MLNIKNICIYPEIIQIMTITSSRFRIRIKRKPALARGQSVGNHHWVTIVWNWNYHAQGTLFLSCRRCCSDSNVKRLLFLLYCHLANIGATQTCLLAKAANHLSHPKVIPASTHFNEQPTRELPEISKRRFLCHKYTVYLIK